jgi:aminopeptidase-like protein
MANNELSGPTVCLDLCNWLKNKNTKYSYRILFLPETIGSISFINKNLKNLKKNTIAGFVLTCLGDDGRFSIINSRYENTYADKIALEELSKLKTGFRKYSYLDRGSDERQFCSPMVNLPFCCITRSKFKSYKQYHTSFDDLNFVKISKLIQSSSFFKKIINKLEKNQIPISQIKCEPFLTKKESK